MRLLSHLSIGDDPLPCPVGADANDDGRLTISDAVLMIRLLFAAQGPGGEALACAVDSTEHALLPCEYPWWTCP